MRHNAILATRYAPGQRRKSSVARVCPPDTAATIDVLIALNAGRCACDAGLRRVTGSTLSFDYGLD
jgi:hypothetical protein